MFMMFKPLDEMLKENGQNELSDIISATMENETWKDMYRPFTLTFKNTKVRIRPVDVTKI